MPPPTCGLRWFVIGLQIGWRCIRTVMMPEPPPVYEHRRQGVWLPAGRELGEPTIGKTSLLSYANCRAQNADSGEQGWEAANATFATVCHGTQTGNAILKMQSGKPLP